MAQAIRNAAMEANQFSAAVAATKEIGVLSGIRIERSERGAPGEFDWLEKLSIDELRLLADGKLDIASYRKDEDAQGVLGRIDMDASLRERLTLQVIARAKLPLAEERDELEGSLLSFVEGAWSSLDPSAYQPCWAIDALCEHLQAVTEGQIRKLLVNFPPRCGKTLSPRFAFPLGRGRGSEQTYLSGPQVRFLCGSYNDDLSLQNSTKHRRLLLSPWYQKRWGKRFTITLDQNTKTQFDTSKGGSRISTSARGSLLGIGGDVVLIDDPHNLHGAESEAERLQALNWWREISTPRLNDPKRAAIVVIMQRLHEDDVSGVILSSEGSSEWTHLCIPMEYELRRHCSTVLGWEDPRGCEDDGEPLLVRDAIGAPVPRYDAAAPRRLSSARAG